MNVDSSIEKMDDEMNIDPKKRGLGRGLNALFGDDEVNFSGAEQDAATESRDTAVARAGGGRIMAFIDQLEPCSYQPRRHFNEDSLRELADSISAHGVLQPIVVRKKRGFGGMFEIIAGERRWRASQIAQLHEVPVIIKELSDEQALEIALIENLQREDLNPVDEARGYKQLIEEFGHTQEKAAAVLGKSRSHVANMMRLLMLPNKVLDMLKDGRLSMGHARTLITADDPLALARIIVEQGLSVRAAERLAADVAAGKKAKSGQTAKPAKDVDTVALEREVSNSLGMKVSIDAKGSKGAGVMKIQYKSLDQLDDVLRRLAHISERALDE